MKLSTYIKRNYELYMMLIPSLIFLIIFHYVPIYGVLLAFKDYDMFAAESPMLSIFASEWVGLEHFRKLTRNAEFFRAFRNTLIISVSKLVWSFPVPIIFAILLSEIRSVKFQKVIQTVVYLPHFLSWVVVSGLFVSLLNSTGLVNQFLNLLGFESVRFLMSNETFRGVLIVTEIWKGFGWGSIIYFAAIAGLDQECFEAAMVDGANRFQKIWHVTIPGLLPTVIMMLIISVGGIMSAGFDQVFTMYNPLVYETADIIDTYVYRLGLGSLDFSTGTAVGLFNSVIGLILTLATNKLSRKFTGMGIW